ncbi:MAG: hypothetical protein M1475_04510 [Actinobacteria bacterium]|nr:hypothetical protein [Actinomycetota bacterium]
MEFSKNKKRLIDTIKRKPPDKIPRMYRALPGVNERLLSYFSLNKDINKSWKDLMIKLNVEAFSSGGGMGKFTTYKPVYNGKGKYNKLDSSMFYTWGIDNYVDKVSDSISYIENTETAKIDSIKDLKKIKKPLLEDFDLDSMVPDQTLRKDYMLGTGVLNSIFMIAMYLRGANNFMIELLTNKKFAHYYIDMIGEFSYLLNKSILDRIGDKIDYYRQWDDMAMQSGMMIPLEIFREFFYPWYKKLFGEAKKYKLITFFHICGNVNEIIPDLIELGVDILDPIQTSAINMDLAHLKKEYGKYISFHGGIDVQGFLQNSSPLQIKKYTEETEEMFSDSGGLILGPSHEITPDTGTENIIAIYRPDLLNI